MLSDLTFLLKKKKNGKVFTVRLKSKALKGHKKKTV